MNALRWLFIVACNILPERMGRISALLCRNIVPPYKEEVGAFRTDIALCAFGLLRHGDVEGFLYWVQRYPFDNRWNGFYQHQVQVAFYDGAWRVNTPGVLTFGKATLSRRGREPRSA